MLIEYTKLSFPKRTVIIKSWGRNKSKVKKVIGYSIRRLSGGRCEVRPLKENEVNHSQGNYLDGQGIACTKETKITREEYIKITETLKLIIHV